jgi:hypothetical protein
MYIKKYNYNNKGEIGLIGILKGDKGIPIDNNNKDYKQYLIDAENGVEVIDNPPTAQEVQDHIDSDEALLELQTLDKILPRSIEDLYNTLLLNGTLVEVDLPAQFNNNVALKIAARTKYNNAKN